MWSPVCKGFGTEYEFRAQPDREVGNSVDPTGSESMAVDNSPNVVWWTLWPF